jgi:small-conductance mechanosensitive channel
MLFNGSGGKMIEWFKLHGIRIAITLVMGGVIYLVFQRLVPRFVKRTIAAQMVGKPTLEAKKRTHTLSSVIRNSIGILIGFVVLFTILAEIGVNIGPALASLGVVGFAVGFGAQSIIKDIINGIFILMENQYSIGDVVKAGGVSGLVEEVNLRRTILRDLDGVVHYIPNGEINLVSNCTKDYSRVNLDITVGYNVDLNGAIKVINETCDKLAKENDWQGKIIKTPQVLRIDKLGESGIDIKILGDTQPLEQWAVTGELRKRIKEAFDNAGIEIPWPHMKVFFGSVPPPK